MAQLALTQIESLASIPDFHVGESPGDEPLTHSFCVDHNLRTELLAGLLSPVPTVETRLGSELTRLELFRALRDIVRPLVVYRALHDNIPSEQSHFRSCFHVPPTQGLHHRDVGVLQSWRDVDRFPIARYARHVEFFVFVKTLAGRRQYDTVTNLPRDLLCKF